MLKKILKIILKPLFVFFLIFCFFSAWYFVSLLDYAKIDKKDLPFLSFNKVNYLKNKLTI